MNQATQPTNGLAPVASEPPDPIVMYVVTHANEVWTKSKPSLFDENLIVESLVMLPEGDVKIYCFPVPGTELDRVKTGMEFTVYALAVKYVGTMARFDVLKEMKEMAIDEALGGDEDEPEAPEEAPAQTNGAQAAPPS